MTLKLTMAALVAAATTATGVPAVADHHARKAEPRQIRVGCDRSVIPDKVIFDRPLGTFVEDLVAIGYTNAEAVGIATRVCRDERFTGNVEALGRYVSQVIAQSPPKRRHH